MIAAWILYALLVGVLAGAGALVLENLLRAHRLPTRWVWAGAMALSLFWPLGHLVWRNWPRDVTLVPLPDPSRIAVLDPLAVQVAPESFLRSLDGPILLVWVLATSVLLVLFGFLILRTRLLRKGWRGEEAGGRSVLFSPDLGPAVVGFLRPQIVLPSWCKELEDQTLRLILEHEVEHLRADDLRLILTAGVLPILLPWHLPIWWSFKRLRLAVEGDCDLRVLRRYPDRARSYLELLLQIGKRAPRAQPLAAMLSEPEETLERRIRIMTMPFPKKPWARGVLLTVVGGFLVAVACWAPSPTDIQEEDAEGVSLGDAEVVQGEEGTPTFTPFTVRPDIRNRSEVVAALEREYPPLLRDAGIGGTIDVWFFIDETGRVIRTLVDKSSGHQALDEAALKVADVIEFTPALNRDRRVPVWISLPVTFTTRGASEEGVPEEPAEVDRVEIIIPPTARQLLEDPNRALPPPPQEGEISAAPTFTPFTVRPDIRNRAEVARALEREYPPLLRDAGIGGTVEVWFFIDDEGIVQRTAIDNSSGHQALDEAALGVARIIEFTPALNRDRRVPVWISLPITFTTR